MSDKKVIHEFKGIALKERGTNRFLYRNFFKHKMELTENNCRLFKSVGAAIKSRGQLKNTRGWNLWPVEVTVTLREDAEID
jgi:hypothetical protein